MQDPSLNRRGRKQTFLGKLLKVAEKAIVETPFNYEVLTWRKLSTVQSAMPMEYIQPYMVIRTSDKDIAFAKGDQVRLIDNTIMTIDNAEEYLNPDLAAMGLDPRDGFTVTLKGGVPA